MITKDDIPEYAPTTIDLPNGWSARIRTEHDDAMGAPWKEHDGHGPVREGGRGASAYKNKQPGERVLSGRGWNERTMFYDFAEAVKIAKKDGWGCPHIDTMEDSATYGGHASKAALAACAAESDFERMRAWCAGEWEWIEVIVEVTDAEGESVDGGSVWGIESDTDYWREVAAEIINELAGGVVLPNSGTDSTAEGAVQS